MTTQVPSRLSANIFATFLVIGTYVPFLPVWMNDHGLSSEQIGFIFAAALWAKVPAGLIISSIGDQTGKRKPLLIVVAVLTLLGFATFPFLKGFHQILIAWVIVGTLLTTMIPLADSLAVIAIQRHGINYGRVRLWGSISFIFISVIGGYWLELQGNQATLTLLIGGSLVMVLSTLPLPDLRETPRQTRRLALFDLVRSKEFIVFVLSASILQASHATLYGFASLHWENAGIGKTVIGLLWAEGVVVEVCLFTFATWIVGRIGIAGLLILAGFAGMIRWGVLGSTTWVPALIAAQALHALTFAGTLIAAINYIADRVPNDQGATAQGLYDGLAMGFLFGVAMAWAGQIYATSGADAFYAMAMMSAAGTLGATCLFLMRRKSRQRATEE